MRASWQSNQKRIINTVFISIATSMLLFPILGQIFGIGKPAGLLNEKRKLADFPNLRSLPLNEVPGKLENYFEDNFPFRESIISTASLVRSLWLKLPSDHVIAGKGSWLFYKGDDIFDDLMGKRSMSSEALANWFARHEAKQNYLAQQEIGYLLATVPNKSTIHTDKLPWWLRVNLRKSRLQQIVSANEAQNQLNLLDLTPAIEALKVKGVQTYWFNDTHWSGHSFRLALDLIFEAVQSHIPELDAAAASHYTEISVNQESGDLANMIGLNSSWPRFDRTQLKVNAPDDMLQSTTEVTDLERYQTLPKGHPTAPIAIERTSGEGVVVVFHDSFLRVSKHSPRFVENHPIALPFKRTVIIWSRPSLEELKEVVEIENPDLVIEQRVERLLYEGNLK